MLGILTATLKMNAMMGLLQRVLPLFTAMGNKLQELEILFLVVTLLLQADKLFLWVIRMYKNTFKMINGDIILDKDLIMVNGQEELRQNIENRLSVNQGEWFLNIGLGLDYPAISGKGVTDKEIELAIRECCLQDDRIKEVRNVTVKRDAALRVVDINITIIDKDENNIFLQEVVNVG